MSELFEIAQKKNILVARAKNNSFEIELITKEDIEKLRDKGDAVDFTAFEFFLKNAVLGEFMNFKDTIYFCVKN